MKKIKKWIVIGLGILILLLDEWGVDLLGGWGYQHYATRFRLMVTFIGICLIVYGAVTREPSIQEDDERLWGGLSPLERQVLGRLGRGSSQSVAHLTQELFSDQYDDPEAAFNSADYKEVQEAVLRLKGDNLLRHASDGIHISHVGERLQNSFAGRGSGR